MVTDICGASTELRRKGSAGEATDDKTYGHEAITETAQHLLDRLGPLLVMLAKADPDFEIVVTGHSLGAGTACLLAVLLREELGLKNVRGVGFATPPVIDRKAALACADYITSVVRARAHAHTCTLYTDCHVYYVDAHNTV